MSEAAFDRTSRLIPGRYVELPEQALADLADPDDLTSLVRLAGATNSRLQAQAERHPHGLSRDDMIFGVPYSKIVNAAFAYPGQGARFHRAVSRGVWYCAVSVETAIAEVAYHRIRMLGEIGRGDETGVVYRQFLADVHGQDFAWLDDHSRKTRACLAPDDYTAGQRLGEDLLDRHAGGIVYPAVRHTGGTNIAVLQAGLVSNVRLGATYTLTIQAGTLTDVRVG